MAPTNKLPFVQQTPNNLESIFASQMGSNPTAPLWLAAMQIGRMADVDAANEAMGEYSAQQSAAANALEREKIQGENVRALMNQPGSLPSAMQLLGLNPDPAVQALQAEINQTRAQGYGQGAGGAESLVKAGLMPDVNFLEGLGIPTTGEMDPLALRERVLQNENALAVANINAGAQIKAAQIRGPSGGEDNNKFVRTVTRQDPSGATIADRLPLPPANLLRAPLGPDYQPIEGAAPANTGANIQSPEEAAVIKQWGPHIKNFLEDQTKQTIDLRTVRVMPSGTPGRYDIQAVLPDGTLIRKQMNVPQP